MPRPLVICSLLLLPFLLIALFSPSPSSSLVPTDFASSTRSALARLSLRPDTRPYDAIVAFGDSFSYNGQDPRSYAMYPYWRGRYSSGEVWVEYLARRVVKKALLVDYALGGSHINNTETATPNSVPSLSSQLLKYTTTPSSLLPSPSSSPRILHTLTTGTSPLTALWITLVQSPRPFPPEVLASTLEAATHQADEAVEMIRTVPGEWVVLSTPPLEMEPFPTQGGLSRPASWGEDRKALGEMVRAYNGRLREGVEAWNNEGGKATFVDVYARWKDYLENPTEHGLSPTLVRSSCYDPRTRTVCPDADRRVYWDGRHPVTSVHRDLAGLVEDRLKESEYGS